MYNASAMKRAPARKKPPAKAAGTPLPPKGGARVVSLLDPDIVLERAAKRFLPQPLDRCVKCHSTFICHEPAFIHCYYAARWLASRTPRCSCRGVRDALGHARRVLTAPVRWAPRRRRAVLAGGSLRSAPLRLGHFGTSDAFARRIADARTRGAGDAHDGRSALDEQVHQTMANLRTTLEAAGSSLGCLLQVTVYLRRQDDARASMRSTRRTSPGTFPRGRDCRRARCPSTPRWRSGIAYIPGQGFTG